MSKPGFGEHLKRERELRGVSLEEICSATRIATRFLQALENEEWERLPGGVFNRGFVRAVARFLGLDEEDLLAEYSLTISELSGAPAGTPAWSGGHGPHQQLANWPVKKERDWRPAVALLVVVVLAAAGWYGWHRYSLHRAQQRVREQHRSAVAPPTSSGAQTPGAGAESATPPEVSSDLSAPPQGMEEKVAANRNAVAGALAGTTAPAVAGALQLKIEAGRATTVTVEADGKLIFEGAIIAGESRTFDARDVFKVATQDAGAILLELNGQTVAPIGPPGQPGKVTLTAGDLPPAGEPH